MINKARLLQVFLDLVQIDSESGQEKDVADYISHALRPLGYQVSIDDSARQTGSNTGNVIAFLPGDEAVATLLFSAHMDTVSPGRGICPVVGAETITASGDTILGGDDKVGIAALLEMATVLHEKALPHGPLYLLFTTNEESGLLGAKNLAPAEIGQVDAGFIFDSSLRPGQIVVQAPRQLNFTATFHGRAAHAGVAPEEGQSAIGLAAEALVRMPLGRISPETTANVGIISGGQATNIVPAEAIIIGEVRSLDGAAADAHMDRIQGACLAAAAGHVTVAVTESYPAFALPEDALPVRLAQQGITLCGLTPECLPTGGGSDANILNSYGLPTVNLGTGMSRVHTSAEFLQLADLYQDAQIACAIIQASTLLGQQ